MSLPSQPKIVYFSPCFYLILLRFSYPFLIFYPKSYFFPSGHPPTVVFCKKYIIEFLTVKDAVFTPFLSGFNWSTGIYITHLSSPRTFLSFNLLKMRFYAVFTVLEGIYIIDLFSPEVLLSKRQIML